MPLLDIATAQPCSCFHNNVLTPRSQSHLNNKFVIGNARRLASSFSWKPFRILEKVGKKIDLGRIEVWRGGLMINAIATLESANLTRRNEGHNEFRNALRMVVDPISPNCLMVEPQSSSEDTTEVDEREKLRRMRISKANKGNRPWNKGRKHTPETLQRIREKTRLAMQDPKVKMKLVKLGHAQSKETRMKIGVGVRLGWEKRREKLILQETCYLEWKNLIAEASRRGLHGEEELQWDSHKILNEQLEQEWLQSVIERKKVARPMGNRRAPKSAEQRRKISEAIRAKWADSEYRNRVCSGTFKFHGIQDGVDRKPKTKPSSNVLARKRSKEKVNETDGLAKHEPKSQTQGVRLKRENTPLYKDPLASSKLKMLKNIRAQRAAADNQKSEAIARAKLLIAEAEEAANALEIVAKNNPLAQASLLETRMLIAEAIHYTESVEKGYLVSYENEDNHPPTSIYAEEENNTKIRSLNHIEKRKVNGVRSNVSTSFMAKGFNFDKFVLRDMVNGRAVTSNSYNNDLLRIGEEVYRTSYSDSPQVEFDVNRRKHSNVMKLPADPKPIGINGRGRKSLSDGQKFEEAETPAKQTSTTKKWVCGRLVQVAEEK